MKKVFLVLLVLLCAAGLAFAAGPAGDASLFGPGNIAIQADLGTGFFYGLDVSGGAELGLGSFKIAPTIPLTYGVAARLGYAGWNLVGYTYSDFAIGGLATLHLSWKNALPDIAWLQKLESYVGLGLGVDFHTESLTAFNNTALVFAGVEGNNWYVTPNLAINLEEGYFGYGYNSFVRIGVVFKL